MAKTSIVLINIAAIGMTIFGLGMAYYFLGNHNCILSRSYFLEKEIRDLHYFETHEAVSSYDDVAKRYKEILKAIRFADTAEKLDEKYQKAVTRAELKAKICHLLDNYLDHQNREALSVAHRIYISTEFETLDYYKWKFVYYRNISLDDEWFQSQLRLVERP